MWHVREAPVLHEIRALTLVCLPKVQGTGVTDAKRDSIHALRPNHLTEHGSNRYREGSCTAGRYDDTIPRLQAHVQLIAVSPDDEFGDDGALKVIVNLYEK
jgi:hypothetical protein